MNDNFKNQLAAFARDVKAICDANPDTCEYCQLRNHGWCVRPLLSTDLDDIDKMLALSKPTASARSRARR